MTQRRVSFDVVRTRRRLWRPGTATSRTSPGCSRWSRSGAMGLEGSEPYERLSRRPYEAASPRSPVTGLRSPGCQRSSRPSAGAPTPACGVGPVVGTEKSDDDTVASRLETIEAVVSITKLPSRCYPFVEDLAGLIRAVSGRWSPEPRQSAASAPRHLGVDQRDERLYIASAERLIGGANRVNSHGEGAAAPLVPGWHQPPERSRARGPEDVAARKEVCASAASRGADCPIFPLLKSGSRTRPLCPGSRVGHQPRTAGAVNWRRQARTGEMVNSV